MLFGNDFNPRSHLFSPRLVGSCFIIPMRFLFCPRGSVSSVGTVLIMPPGASTSQVFDYLVHDIVKARVEGIESFDEAGKIAEDYIDMCGFLETTLLIQESSTL